MNIKFISIGFFLSFAIVLTTVSAQDRVMCTMDYNPVCGQTYTKTCTDTTSCTESAGELKTYSNRCMMNAANATFVHSGQCEKTNTSTPSQEDILVDWAYKQGISQFSTVSDFQYNNALTRQEAAAFAVRVSEKIFQKKSESQSDYQYSDNKDIDSTLLSDVMKAKSLGIMFGYNNIFSPKNTLSYAEAMAIAVRIVDGKKYTETTNPWYQEYQNRLKDFGIIFSNDLQADEAISRWEFLEWMQKISTKTTEQTSHLNGNWILASVSGLTTEEKAQLQKEQFSITFTDNTFSAKICNRMNANFTTKDDILQVPNMASTLMFCEGLAGKLEMQFQPDNAQIKVVLPTEIKGGTKTLLTITTKNGVVFTFHKQ